MIITFANQKGGVGKSTLTVNMAAAIHETFQEPVMVVDLDNQETAAEWVEKGALPVSATRKVTGDQLTAPGFVLLDTPGNLHDPMTQKAIEIADVVVIPCNSAPGAMAPTSRTIAVVKKVKGVNPIVVLTDLRQGSIIERAILEWSQTLGVPVAKTILHRREIFPQTQVMGSWVQSGPAREQLLALVAEILRLHQKQQGKRGMLV